jgi:dienelactone hydrolase
MTSSNAPGRARVVISPQRPHLDTVLGIQVFDLPPRTAVTVRATQHDPHGRVWSSSATFTSQADGSVDLHRDAPIEGSYSGADPMGLIWSMEALDESVSGIPAGFLAPTTLTVAAEVHGEQVCCAQVHRLRVPDGLARTEVREHGLVGTLYRPDDDRVLPGVLLLGGSEGGMHEDDAALLAAHGYAVLALAYYGMPGLPSTLQGIPLEYFAQALRFLRTHAHVDGERLTVMGASKGGEAALLIGATFPQPCAVISVVGSGLITQGISQDVLTGSFLDIMTTPVANWTYQGRPLPYLPNVVTPELEAAVAAGAPVALRMAIEPDLARNHLLPAVTIPVERINGPVLLISGEQDLGYGAAFHHLAAKRLAANNHPYKHIVYPGAGHLIAAPPYAPTTRSTSPGPGVTFDHGGAPAANAHARADAWQQTIRFLAATRR